MSDDNITEFPSGASLEPEGTIEERPQVYVFRTNEGQEHTFFGYLVVLPMFIGMKSEEDDVLGIFPLSNLASVVLQPTTGTTQ